MRKMNVIFSCESLLFSTITRILIVTYHHTNYMIAMLISTLYLFNYIPGEFVC